MPNVLSPRDLVFRPDNMDETVPHTHISPLCGYAQCIYGLMITLCCFTVKTLLSGYHKHFVLGH